MVTPLNTLFEWIDLPRTTRSSGCLYALSIETPLGPMIGISDDVALHLLEFTDGRGVEKEIKTLHLKTKKPIISGRSQPLESIQSELNAYFKGTLKSFKTPLHLSGTPFQKDVWNALLTIPYGETRSYGSQSAFLGKPTAQRAVANANGANQLAIIVPCHRVINTNGNLGGYGGKIHRKEWLIKHEAINQ